MPAHVIGVVRSAHRLDTLIYEAKGPVDPTEPWKREQTCELRPLAPPSDLASAWQALARVDEWNDETLAHVLTVLRQTVPSLDAPSDLPTLGVNTPPAPRATAANPRAFRGTKYQPPKPRRPEPVDVRPYLLTRRHTDDVLEQLDQSRGTDPYVSWHHGVQDTASFDPAFVTYLLPLFRTCTWSDVGAFAALARSMELHVQPELRTVLTGVFIGAGSASLALSWWSYVLAHEPEQRVEVAQIVSVSGVAAIAPPEPAFAAVVARLPALQQWSIYSALLDGAEPAYISSGLELGAISTTKIEELPPGRRDLTSLIEETMLRLVDAAEVDSGADFWRTHVWRLCGYQPELVAVLESALFVALHPEAAFQVIRLASSPRWTPETADKEWKVLAPTVELTVEFASRVTPEYQRKFVEDYAAVYSWAIDNEHDATDALAHCVDLCFRIAKPPFSTESTLGTLLQSLGLVYTEWNFIAEHRAIRDAPDTSWLALEDACKRRNQMRLIARGLDRLSQYATKLLATTFTTSPGALFETAEALATLSFEAAEEILVRHAKSPLADPAIADAPLEKLCELIEPIAKAGGPNPIRRALREHLAGTSILSDLQLKGHRERIVADFGIVRLAAIRQAVDRTLASRIGAEKIETPRMRHALAMLTNVDVHRRQLKRMIAATNAGDANWKREHPRSKEWLARHPKLDVESWLRGIEMRVVLDGIGEIRVAVETDPLEALKLGTYVGSCLGRGGNFEFSAAAVVLDINKQVVYARDGRGTVVGRQLVALSEEDELVCFYPYGSAKTELIQPVFRELDRAFAAKLGIPLAKDAYVIASVLSHDWYDDSSWPED